MNEIKEIKLRCRTNEFPFESDDWLSREDDYTVGKIYDAVMYEYEDTIILCDNDGNEDSYSIYPDDEGLSYATWFDLVSEEDDVNE